MFLPLVLSLLVFAVSHPVSGQGAGSAGGALAPNQEIVEVSATNWIARVITNVTEIRCPSNVFVTEYRTNWIERLATNAVEVYRAVWRTQTLTNIVPVEIVETNQVIMYQTNRKALTLTNWETVVVTHTNWVQQPLTNVVEVSSTNWVTWTFTKTVPVESVRTNVVVTYQTNWRTTTVTNLETIVQTRTNWVRRQVTNIVELEMLTNPPVAGEMAGSKAPSAEAAPALAPVEGWDAYLLETATTGRPATNNQVEVLLKVKLAADPSAALEVQSWRVERADRTILLFGQEPEFKRNLPFGSYHVQVKVREDPNSSFSTLRATIAVTPEGVTSRSPR